MSSIRQPRAKARKLSQRTDLPTSAPDALPPLRKLGPTARLPEPAVFASFRSADRHLLKRLVTETAECVYSPLFEQPGADLRFMAPPPSSERGTPPLGNDDSGADMLLGPDQQVLPIDQERHLFLRLNYARHRVMQTLAANRSKRLSAADAATLIRWEHVAMETRSEIVRINVPLVLAMVKRTRITGVDYADLISEGNLALLRAVDKFDCARGFKFSTYACRAILKSFARVAARTARYRVHFPTEFDPVLEKSDAMDRKRAAVENDCVEELKAILDSNTAKLNPVEQRVIKARFAIENDDGAREEVKTLEQVGEMIGVTKERVRQIQNKALGKLRALLEDGVLAMRQAQ